MIKYTRNTYVKIPKQLFHDVISNTGKHHCATVGLFTRVLFILSFNKMPNTHILKSGKNTQISKLNGTEMKQRMDFGCIMIGRRLEWKTETSTSRNGWRSIQMVGEKTKIGEKTEILTKNIAALTKNIGAIRSLYRAGHKLSESSTLLIKGFFSTVLLTFENFCMWTEGKTRRIQSRRQRKKYTGSWRCSRHK